MAGKDRIAIGEKLQTARKQKEMSLRELATKAEMSASMLSQIENGKAFPSVRSIYTIAAALELPVDYFFPSQNEQAPMVAEKMTASDLREAQLNGDIDSSAPSFDTTLQSSETPVVHVATRPTIELKGGVTWSRLTARAEEYAEFLEIVYTSGANSGVSLSHHVGREFGLVLEGELIVELGFERHTLAAGDSIIFDSTTPHRLSNECSLPARAVWIVLTPNQNK